jgi:competence protein ComEC
MYTLRMLHLRRYLPYLPYFALAALVCSCIGIWGAVAAATPPGVLTIAVMDVGQGDSIFIESPTGVQVVIDGGPDDSILTRLPTLMSAGDRTLDAVIETHPDADHIAGLVDLIARYQVKNFIEPGIPKDTLTAKRLEEEVDSEKIRRIIARRGMLLDLGGGAYMKVLFPDFDAATIPQSKDNDGGIVVQLFYASTTALFMADVSSDVEDHLVALDGGALDSDFLKVGHHGSRTSTDDEFLDEVTPDVAVISVGKDNTYGHPTPETLGRLSAHHIKTLRTDQEGTIVFTSNGNEFVRTR